VFGETDAIARARGWREPFYSTVYSVIPRPAALVELAHDGPKAYANRFELLYRRARPTDTTRCGKPITRRWISGSSMNGDAQPGRG
jgi:hypothetical protein